MDGGWLRFDYNAAQPNWLGLAEFGNKQCQVVLSSFKQLQVVLSSVKQLTTETTQLSETTKATVTSLVWCSQLDHTLQASYIFH